MKLLFDLNSLRPPRSGIGYYTQHLLEGLSALPDVDDIAGWAADRRFYGEEFDAVVRGEMDLWKAIPPSSEKPVGLINRLKNWPAIQPLRTAVHRRKSKDLRRDFARSGYIYHETNFIASRYKGPTVVTVHDVSHVPHPEFQARVTVEYLNRHLPGSLKQAQVIIADSLYTKKDLVEIYRVPEQKVVPIHLGVEASFRPYPNEVCLPVLEALGLKRGGFVLSVCTLQPRKNLPRLVQAFAKLPADMRQTFPLVLIGADGWQNSELLTLIEPLLESREAVMPGYLRRDDLLKLFASAAVFAYPSLYEGFGLPVAEAMASGVPVLTSNLTSIPEVCAGAALEVDAYSVEDIASGLQRLLSDSTLRDQLVQKGLRRAAELTWESTVAQTCSVYRSLI
ncbi:glycosyltransferase family 1 protein [Paraburkholderia sp. SARCC-3016]|uniref:glycosyltransferase family 4 protein n=1 Tax=Paraburkholderia sp. SARCC-3016 TaxID=3058611 RepID=UPI0028073BD8|nr:glycosyltransferase family 1 protein [Paraburkholderia sp. SARCC-3016]MDQ7978078.1 glycosyltransferase family 1 protein [Paraburkholderia sp. SARCC-3016]